MVATGVERRQFGDTGFELESRAGKARVIEVVPGVVDVTYEGLAHAEFVQHIHELLDRRIAEGHKVTVCVNAEKLVSYDAEFRRIWTSWFRANAGRFHQVPMLFRSALVRMGVNLVNPLIGNQLLPMSDPADYRRAVQRAAARARATAGQSQRDVS